MDLPQLQPQPVERETMYGKSLGLNIPRLTCSDVDCTQKNIFTPPDHEVDANTYILHLINCFVDFFIQYQTIDDEPAEVDITKLLELKKMIFSLCVESRYVEDFFNALKENCIIKIKNEFKVVQNVGDPDASRIQTIQNVKPKQRSTNFFLLCLSYKVLSMSGSLGIQIKDISDIIQDEKQRESGGKQGFILQFLPFGKEITCFQRAEIFFLDRMNSIIFRRISTLSAGGSKRVLKTFNRSIKNKHKHKCKMNAYKGQKSKRYRRKRTQSNQNKMF
jgi:hypothetical protein